MKISLSDFHHLPQLDLYLQQIEQTRSGVIVVAGSGAAPDQPQLKQMIPGTAILPSGRSLIFNILLQMMLEAHPDARALIVTQDKDHYRVARPLKQRVAFAQVDEQHSYLELIEQAAARSTGLLVIDALLPMNLTPILDIARRGFCILTQLDSLLFGTAAVRQLADWGANAEQLEALAWIVSVQRVQALCPHCKTPSPVDALQLHRLRHQFPDLFPAEAATAPKEQTYGELDLAEAAYYQSKGCDRCGGSGRHGDIAAFDIWCGGPGMPISKDRASLLSMGEYLLHLAALGHLSLDDVLDFPTEQLQRIYYRMAASEQVAREAQAAMARKLAELEVANRVTTQRTGMLVSLHDISQTLINSTELDDLAKRICRHARDICGAERAVLYYQRSPNEAEVLAVNGCDALVLHQAVASAHIAAAAPRPFALRPPGTPPAAPGQRADPILTGMLVPLVAQERQVGALLVQALHKRSFTPGEVAMLQTLAGQAAIAIQRAGLISELRQKIEQLEAAQAEIVKKERLERELELAHQVQQSLLPRAFPVVKGFSFSGRCAPARQVGGDFYDAFWIDSEHLGLAIADVSDKGMPAALYMALCRSLLLAEARRSGSPAAVLAAVNRLLLEVAPQQMFITVFFAIVEISTRVLTYVRAGHERPLLLRKDTVIQLPGNGSALGVFEDPPLENAKTTLLPDDRLILYTDGLPDAMSPDAKRFELVQLIELLRERSNLPAERLCAEVFARLAEYQAGVDQFDDMTMMIVEIS